MLSFNEFRYQPSVAEVNSWNNSLRAVSQVFQTALLLDHGVLLELRLPLTSKRLDCLVTGYDGKNAPNAVIIDAKARRERTKLPLLSAAISGMCFILPSK